MILAGDTLLLESKDIENWKGTKGRSIRFLAVPSGYKDSFFDSNCWKALFPCLVGNQDVKNSVIFYDEEYGFAKKKDMFGK